MNTTKNNSTRIERTGHLRWLKVDDIKVAPMAQREVRPGHAAKIAAEFDPDRFLPPLVSHRDGSHYVIDGQHRLEAMRLLGWGDRQVQCWVYEGLTEADDADLFLWHNNNLSVRAFDRFRIGVVAQRDVESDIDRIVRSRGLRIANGGKDRAISAVGALRRVYDHGPGVLARTLKIVDEAYGNDGLDGVIIEGIGLVCARYNGELDDDKAISRLRTTRGGVGALNSRAHSMKRTLGKSLAQCYAAAAVDIVNAGKGGKKLPMWWS